MKWHDGGVAGSEESGSEVALDDDAARDRERQSAASSDPSRDAREAVGAAIRFWWVSVLRGCLALLLGLGALISGASQSALVNFIAVYWLFGGLLTARWALGIRWKAGSRVGLIAGVLAIVTGIVLLTRRGLADVMSIDALLYLVAVTTIVTGSLRLLGAFEIEERTGHRWTFGGFILGSIEIASGIVLLLARDARASTLRVTIGVWGLAAGVLLLTQGARMLRIRRAIG